MVWILVAGLALVVLYVVGANVHQETAARGPRDEDSRASAKRYRNRSSRHRK